MAKDADKTTIELHGDAWQRFERAVDVVAKSPPQHKIKGKKAKPSEKGAKRRTNPGSKQNNK
jgi:hypothetical protein